MILSIIVPVYNVEEYLEECLNSLVIQKIDKYEIICINDGSKDDSGKILKMFEMKYPNLIKIYDKENGGLADTRNFGLKKASGKYVGFVDSDDWISDFMFKELIDRVIKEDADIGICDYTEVYSEKEIYISDSSEYKLLYESLVCNKIFKKKLFDDNKIIFPVGLWYEDNAVTYKLLFLANKIFKLNESGYYYRRTREGSIMNSQKSKKIYDMREIYKDLSSFFEKFELSKDLYEQVEYIMFRNTIFRQIPKIIKYESLNILKGQKEVQNNFRMLEKNFSNWQHNSLINEDKNNYYKFKLGKNHMKKLLFIRKNNFFLILILIFKKVGELSEKK